MSRFLGKGFCPSEWDNPFEKCLHINNFLLIFLIGRGGNSNVSGRDLIGGHWNGTAGYKDGKIEGEPYCYPFHEGIEFNDEKTVYVERDFEYKLTEGDNGTIIDLYDKEKALYSYHIEMISEKEVGLIGEGDIQAD